jgi:hypothetical protein
LKVYQKTILTAIRELYVDKYQRSLTESALQALNSNEMEEDVLERYLNADSTPKEEFDIYFNGQTTQLPDDHNLFVWWANSGAPQLAQMAYNLLTILGIFNSFFDIFYIPICGTSGIEERTRTQWNQQYRYSRRAERNGAHPSVPFGCVLCERCTFPR